MLNIYTPLRQVIFAALFIFLGVTGKSQIVSNNAFIKGNYVQVGISPCGSFGSSVCAPTGYNPRGGSTSCQLGFVADPAKDGWGTGFPNYIGDYFLPGSPEEGWGLTINGTNYNNNMVCAENNIPGSFIAYNNTPTEVSATWQGSIAGLSITARTYIPVNSVYFVTEVTLVNTSANPINNIYYMRNVDPDHGVNTPGSSGYTTNNTIVYQNPNSCNRSLVSATTISTNHYLGLGSIDSRSKVIYGGFSNRNAQAIWNGTGFTSTQGSSASADAAVAIAFNVGNLAPNGTAKFAYAYILDASQLSEALAATNINLDVNGLTYNTGNTADICSSTSVPITITNPGGYTSWTWSPSTGLNTTTGTTVNATLTGPITYTATGSGVCGTVNVNITVNPQLLSPPGAAGPITGPQRLDLGQTGITYSIAPVTNATSYFWQLPPGSVVTSSSSTSNTITFNASNTSWCGTVTVHPYNACASGTPSTMDVCITNITTGTVAAGPHCAGAAISVPFTIGGGSFAPGNTFTAQLSDSSGSFTNAVNIGTLTGVTSGTISATIPTTVTGGSKYRVRVISSIPSATGWDNGSNITINVIRPAASINGTPRELCSGTSITFNASVYGQGTAPSYQWKRNGANVGNNATSYTANNLVNGDIISFVLTSNANCAIPTVVNSNDYVVRVNPDPAVSIVGSTCEGDSITVNSPIVPTQIVWKRNGVTVKTSTSSILNSSVVAAGGNFYGPALNQLASAAGVFVDASGNVYVADRNNFRVVKWAPGATTGVVVAGVTGNPGAGLNQLNSPTGVFVDLQGNLYVADFGNHRVVKWAPNASSGVVVAGGNGSGAAANQLNGPQGIFVDNGGNIYISDQQNHRVQKWIPGAAEGTTVAGGNGSGSAANQLTLPHGIALDKMNNIYVSDQGSSRVQKWTVGATSGVTVAGGNGSGSAANQLTIPFGLYVDNMNNVFVADYFNARIQKWAEGATTGVTVAGGNGIGNGSNQVSGPAGIFMDASGNLYVSEEFNNRVGKFPSVIDSIYKPTTAGDYKALVTVLSGCASETAVFTVGTRQAPEVTINASQTSLVCAGTAVTFTVNNTVNAGTNPGYQWQKNGVNVGTNSTSYTDDALLNNDVIRVIMSSDAGCLTKAADTSNTIVVNVGSSLAPTVSITANKTSICAGNSVTFTATATNGGTAPVYQWKKNGTSVGTNSRFYTTTALAQGDNVWVEITSNAICATTTTATSNTLSIPVTTSVTPTISISTSTASVCHGATVTFNANITNGGINAVYQWKKNGFNVGTNSPSYSENTLTNGDIITCELTSGASCASPVKVTSNSITMTVGGVVTPYISIVASNSSICIGNTVTFTATAVNGGATPNYQWYKNNVAVGTNSNTYVNGTLANGDVIYCVYTTSVACATSSSVTSNSITIIVNPVVTPEVTISASQNPICGTNSAIFTATPVNGGANPTYMWYKNGTAVGNNSATYTDNGLVNGAVISCIMVTDAPCPTKDRDTSNAITMVVNTRVTPTIDITASLANACSPTTPITFTASTTGSGDAPTFQWKKNGVNVGGNTVQYTDNNWTSGDVITCHLTSSLSCVSGAATSNSITITVTSTVTPSVTISTPGVSCLGQFTTITATAVNGGSSPEYRWYRNGTLYTTSFGSNSLGIYPVAGEEWYVVLVSSMACTSPATDTSNVIVFDPSPSVVPSVTLAASQTTICTGGSVTFTATPTNGGTSPTYTWYRNSSYLTSGSSPTYTTSALANNDLITCVMTSNHPCRTITNANSNQVRITVSTSVLPSASIVSGISCSPFNYTFNSTSVAALEDMTGATQMILGTDDGSSGVFTIPFTFTFAGNSFTQFSASTNGLLGFGPLSVSSSYWNESSFPSNVIAAWWDDLFPSSITPMVAYKVVGSAGSRKLVVNWNTSAGIFQAWLFESTNIVQLVYGPGSTGSSATVGLAATSSNFYVVNVAAGTASTTTRTDYNYTFTNLQSFVFTPCSGVTNVQICEGETGIFYADIRNGGTTPAYQWKKNGVNVGTNSSSYSDNALVNGDQITLTLTSNAGCASPAVVTSSAVTINVSPYVTPDVSIAASTTNICAGTSVTFTATASGVGATPFYQWRVNGLPAGTNSATFSSTTLTDNSVVDCIVTSSASCKSRNSDTSNSINISVSNAVTPTVNITTTNYNLCGVSEVTFTALTTNAGDASYTWLKNGTTIVGSDTSVFITSALVAGDNIRCRVTPANACFSSSQITSNIITLMNSTLTAPSVVSNVNGTCGAAVTLNATAPAGANVYWYTAVTGGTPFASGSPTVVTPMTNSTFYAEASRLSSSSKVVSLPNSAAAVFEHNSVTGWQSGGLAVSPNYVYYTGNSYTGRFSKNNFSSNTQLPRRVHFFSDLSTGRLWQFGTAASNGNSFSGSATRIWELDENLEPTGNFVNLTSSVTLSYGCFVAAGQGFVVVYFSGSFRHINLNNGTVTALSSGSFNYSLGTGGVSYGWAEYDGTYYNIVHAANSTTIARRNGSNGNIEVVKTFSNLGFMNSILYDPSTSRMYFQHQGASQFAPSGNETIGYLDVTVKDSTLCKSTRSAVNVTVTPALTPAVSISASQTTICAGNTVTFTAIATNGGTAPQFQWKKNGTNVATGEVYVTNSLSIGDIITCQLTSNATCATATPVTSNSITITVGSSVSPTVSIAFNPTAPCEGSTVRFTATPINSGTAPTYQWYKNGVMVGTNAAIYESADFANGDSVYVSMSSNAACVSGAMVASNGIKLVLTTPVVPSVTISASQTTICTGNTVAFTATAVNAGSPVSYQWKRNGINVGSNSPTFNLSTLANGDLISCVVTVSEPCATASIVTSNTIGINVQNATATINTIAGNGSLTYNSDNIQATLAGMNPYGINKDKFGNIYIADYNNDRIRKVSPDGVITTVAGGGTAFPGDGGAATNASIDGPLNVVSDAEGNIYFVEYNTHRVRKVTVATGIITTIAGTGTAGYSGDGSAAVLARLNAPTGLDIDANNNLYVADYFNHRIRKINLSSGLIVTVAGNGSSSQNGDNGLATSAGVYRPYKVKVDKAGNFYIACLDGHVVRKVTASTGIITTIAGTGLGTFGADGGLASSTTLYSPAGVAVDTSFNVYIAEFNTNRVRKIDASSGILSTVAGTGTRSFFGDGGAAINAGISGPQDVFIDDFENLFVIDIYANRVRKIIKGPGIPDAPSLTAGSRDICAGSSTTLTITSGNLNGASSWRWYSSACGTGLIGTGTTLTVSPTTTTTYYVRAEGGCATTGACTPITINVTPVPVASVELVASQVDFCLGDNVTFTAIPTNGGTAPSYQWKVNGVNTGSNSATFTTNSLPNGAIVTVQMTSNASCAATAPVTSNSITMTAGSGVLPSVSVAASVAGTCEGSPVTFTATSINGGTSPTYQWKKNGINVGSNSVTYVDNTLTSTDAITCLITSNASCLSASTDESDTVRVTITPYRSPAITITANLDAICAGASVTFTASASNGGSAPVYQWKKNGVVVGGSTANYVTNTLVNGDVITCTLTSNENCVTTTSAVSNTITMSVYSGAPTISTIAGNGSFSFSGDGGLATSASGRFYSVTKDKDGNTYVADFDNNRIRKIAVGTNIITTVAGSGIGSYGGDGGPATNAYLQGPSGVAVSNDGSLYIADRLNNRIRKVDGVTGIITTIAGNGLSGYAGDGGPAISARIYWPTDVKLDASGNLYITDRNNHRIRRVDATTGIISTVAGDGFGGFIGDGVPATSTSLYYPVRTALDLSGNLYISDAFNYRVRKVDATSGIISTVVGTGFSGFGGDNGLAINASVSYPFGLAVDISGDLYLSDWDNHRVRKITAATGIITTVAGTGSTTYNGDNISATTATLYQPSDVYVDNLNNFFIADYSHSRIRRVVQGRGVPDKPLVVATADTICAGSSTTLSISEGKLNGATGWRWYSAGCGTGLVATGNSINVSPTATTTYYVRGEGGSCAIAGSCDTITITVNPMVTASVSIVASKTSICNGETVTFTATPTNGGASPAFQWKVNGTNAGINSNTFSTTTLGNNDVVTVVMTTSVECATAATATSNAVTMTVNPNLTPLVSIATSNTTICAGSSVTFTATPTNGGTTPAYQWKVNGVNAGSNSATFTTSTLTNGAVVTATLTSNATCLATPTAVSNSISMNVTPTVTPSVIIAASQNNICAGTSVTFTATPTNGGTMPVYQWRVNGVNAGSNSPTFSSSTLANGAVVTVRMTSNATCPSPSLVTSNGITMNVTANVTPAVSIAATQSTICAGTAVTFTATPVNGGSSPAYQWKVNGVDAGTNSATFNSNVLANGDVVTVVMSSSAVCKTTATATSNAVTMTVNPNLTPLVSIATSNTTICAGSSVTFTATPTNGGTTPAYQWKVNGVNAGSNSATFTTSTLTNGAVVTATLTSNATCLATPTAVSNSISMTVNPTITPAVSLTPSSLLPGGSVTFTASATNGGSAPVYTFKVNGSTVQSGTSNQYVTSSLVSGSLITVQLTSNANCASPANMTSNVIVMGSYVFEGNGNWSNSANWLYGLVPPTVIPSGLNVLIKPVAGGECVSGTITIQPGGRLAVDPGKKLVVNGSIIQQ